MPNDDYDDPPERATCKVPGCGQSPRNTVLHLRDIHPDLYTKFREDFGPELTDRYLAMGPNPMANPAGGLR